MQPKGPSVRKRAQIDSANRTMFLWVAGVSVVFGFASVAVIFLMQMLIFNERVLIEKDKTVSNLNSNIKLVKQLETNVKKLDANQDLIDSKANSDDQAIQVILDALPSDANSNAFGASLQNKIIATVPNLELNSLQINPVAGIESLGDSGLVVDGSSVTAAQIDFSFSVSGDEVALKQVLENIEKSIRPIDIVSLRIESQGAMQSMHIKGRTFFEPAIEVELKSKVVK